tara:strand:+ start:675 stop:851 length:177 start_codon:yes stop_codon:yes gene_type:complete
MEIERASEIAVPVNKLTSRVRDEGLVNSIQEVSLPNNNLTKRFQNKNKGQVNKLRLSA